MANTKPRSMKSENFLYMRSAPALTWRLDPDDSLSDWTLRIWSSDDPSQRKLNKFLGNNNMLGRQTSPFPVPGSAQIKTYFVHRSVLAVGPRSSEYFALVFKGANEIYNADDSRDDCSHSPSSASKNVTKIELLPSAVACIPTMLDYLYAAPGTPLDISSKNAIAMRHLASSFGIKSLFNDTSDFIKRDLNPETAPLYLVESRKFKNGKVSSTAIKTIAKNFEGMKVTALSTLSVQYLIDIVQSGFLKIKDKDKYCSKIATYCRCRRDELNLRSLECFTPPELMPSIAEKESLYFLELYLSLGGSEDQDKAKKSLFSRCLEQAPASLQHMRSGKMDPSTSGKAACRHKTACLELYSKLPDRIKVKLLEGAPGSATGISATIENNDSQSQSQSSFESLSVLSSKNTNKKKETSRREREAKKELMKMRSEMEGMKMTHEKKLEYFKQKLGKKDKELEQVSAMKERMEIEKEKHISFQLPSCFGSI